MIRRLLLASALFAVVGFGFGQTTFVIDPTQGEGIDAIAKGSTSASVTQTVELILPQATALHLDASTLVFDLTALDGEAWHKRAWADVRPDDWDLACVYAVSDDVRTQLDSTFWNQVQVVPGGVPYVIDGSGSFPRVSVTGEQVVNYPPLKLDEAGELVEGSKDHFVCYQSFIIQLFSNFGYWDLSVSRADTTDQGIEHLYVQGNVCSTFGAGTGLYALEDNTTVHLIPKTLNAGTTGDRVNAACGNTNTSWLDVLGVMAVKINSDNHGTSTANLTYTLMSSDQNFPN